MQTLIVLVSLLESWNLDKVLFLKTLVLFNVFIGDILQVTKTAGIGDSNVFIGKCAGCLQSVVEIQIYS